jgi:hypothetical protein
MDVMLPASVDVKELVGTLNLSPTRSKSIKNKIYYFLSQIMLTNDNYDLNEKKEGYHRISSVLMKKIMGRMDYYLILQLLSNPQSPVIESNNSWHNGKQGGEGYCQGYRLCQAYNTGEVVYRTIPAKFQRRIEKHYKNDRKANFDDSKYQFLYNQLDSNKLRFDPSVYDYIYSFEHQLLSKAGSNEFQTNLVYNLIGRWLYYVEKIENDNIWRQVSPANWRLNSSLTQLNRTLRSFLLFDGEKLGEIDITASQPYILSAVMRDEFLTGHDGCFNLLSISPDIFQKLIKTGYISSSSQESIYSFAYTSYSGSTMHTEFNPDISSSVGSSKETYSFMWSHFFNDKELESIRSYQAAPFDNDFYMHLVSKVSSKSGQKTLDEAVLRERIKNYMRFVLFDDNPKHRNNGTYFKMFRELYPGVDKLIYDLLKEVGKTDFSYLLQRAESYLILDVISRDFHEKFPSAPVYTIHDAICTYPDYFQQLTELTAKHFMDITGIPVGLKVKPWQPDPFPRPEDINEEWLDINPVISLQKYQEKAHSVFSSNIARGKQFISLRH